MAQKKGVRKRKCVRCANGQEVFRNEVDGLRSYESYWHMSRAGRMTECIDGVHHESDRLRQERDWLRNRVNELLVENRKLKEV